MKNKIIQFIPALVTLLIIGFRYFSIWCADSILSCYSSWINQIALSITKPLYLFSLFFLPIAIVLAFVPRYIFNSWLKFAAWSLPLLFVLVATQPVVSSFLSTNRDDAARLAGQVFAAISLLLIVWRALHSART
ncbi:hypothetical protein A2118_03210 [Candidatus Kaiserbacteria bacterium GWA2_50_9]|uniref:Uncharacterized protein n=1 Tax=Candidatus Kaiserbacteria bacterium GWA2_50_9 TaxID=1798474 RepID=A0A1F6BS63_9BACT|nr:MAG: hypothetical protein A2118_03210 [Candidatus Kaiserbacteria bacterium GWA2_50_9]